MLPEQTRTAGPVAVSIGIFAWNEERAIASTLESLLAQSLFKNLRTGGSRAEVVCVLNGCTDRTAEVAAQVFARRQLEPSEGEGFLGRVVNLAERGKINAWNQFVHSISERQAKVLFMMDADILIHRPDTLWNMLRLLETDPEATVAVDRPCKHLLFQKNRSVRDQLSLASSQITLSAQAQLCGQLYAIRAAAARNIYLPRDLAACEDGFIKALVCTDSLLHEVWPRRVRVAEDAEHTFEAYTSPAAILRNQKRQMIGQTVVHILVDRHLKALPEAERRQLAQTLRAKESADPAWLKRLIVEHLRQVRYFWRLYPGLLTNRFAQWRNLRGLRRLICYPAALAGCAAAMLSSWMAFRTLKSGCTDYWPKAQRLGLGPAGGRDPAGARIALHH